MDKTAWNLNNDVEKVQNFAKEELQSIEFVVPKVAVQVVDDKSPTVLHCVWVRKGQDVHALNECSQLAACNDKS